MYEGGNNELKGERGGGIMEEKENGTKRNDRLYTRDERKRRKRNVGKWEGRISFLKEGRTCI
jgi:hypothetical protein